MAQVFQAYTDLAALVIQVVFLAVVLSVVGVYVKRILDKHLASRQDVSVRKVSHADAARARAAARAKARALA